MKGGEDDESEEEESRGGKPRGVIGALSTCWKQRRVRKQRRVSRYSRKQRRVRKFPFIEMNCISNEHSPRSLKTFISLMVITVTKKIHLEDLN